MKTKPIIAGIAAIGALAYLLRRKPTSRTQGIDGGAQDSDGPGVRPGASTTGPTPQVGKPLSEACDDAWKAYWFDFVSPDSTKTIAGIGTVFSDTKLIAIGPAYEWYEANAVVQVATPMGPGQPMVWRDCMQIGWSRRPTKYPSAVLVSFDHSLQLDCPAIPNLDVRMAVEPSTEADERAFRLVGISGKRIKIIGELRVGATTCPVPGS